VIISGFRFPVPGPLFLFSGSAIATRAGMSRHTSLLLPLCLLASPACSYASYTPPSRTMPLETAAAPSIGRTDLQIEINRVGAVMGFDTTDGAARIRRGVTDHVALTAEAGVLHVNGGSGQGDPNAFLGRVGFHVHSSVAQHIALTGGIGSGRSALAGSWATGDLGFAVSTETKHFVPFFAFEVYGSAPLHERTFTYATENGDPQTDQLTPTRGARATAGFEWRPGQAGPDSKASLLVGFQYGVIADSGDDDEVMGLGAAMKFKLD
jgi:hypothetical protein